MTTVRKVLFTTPASQVTKLIDSLTLFWLPNQLLECA